MFYTSDDRTGVSIKAAGSAIIVTFGNYPLRTKYTPSYKCPYYQMGTMDMGELRSHMFRADEVYYDLEERNDIVLGRVAK